VDFGHQLLQFASFLVQFGGERGREQCHWHCHGEVVAQVIRFQQQLALLVLLELVRILLVDEEGTCSNNG
jgi:hypothetical protein